MVSSIFIKYNYFWNKPFKPIDTTLADTTTPGHSKPGSNGHKGVTPYSPEFQNQSLTNRGNSVF